MESSKSRPNKEPDAQSPGYLDGPIRKVKRGVTPTAPVADTAAPTSAANFAYQKSGQNRHWKKWALIAIGGLVVVALIFFGIKLFIAGRNIINRNTSGGAPALSGNIDPTRLKGEGDGRINILLLGIGGQGHEGPYLSDTIMLVSIDPRTKDVAMLSIPRDLWVAIPGYGSAKLNAACSYGETEHYPGGCGALAKATLSKILDIPIHYYIRLDFSGFKQAIDSVGGVDVYVDKALYDNFYPDDRENGKYIVVNVPAGLHHMDGTLALRYARSRETTSDFDRAARQQKVLLALRQKALSLGTLTNPAKIASLIDIVGAHAKTDLQLPELKKLATIAKDIDTTKVINKVLDTSADGLLVDHSGDSRGYIELPKSGNWDDIREFVHSIFIDSYIKDEAASIEVQNGTLRQGLATSVGKMLKGYGYNVTSMVTAATQNHSTSVIYDYTNGKKPYTISYLEKRFGVKSVKMTPTAGDPDIRIIVGNDYKITTSN